MNNFSPEMAEAVSSFTRLSSLLYAEAYRAALEQNLPSEVAIRYAEHLFDTLYGKPFNTPKEKVDLSLIMAAMSPGGKC